VFYNRTFSGLSVAVALVIETIELASLVAQELHAHSTVRGWLGIRLHRSALPPTPAPPSRKPLPGSVRSGSAPTVGPRCHAIELIESSIELPSNAVRA
jgi:hypothetical protein